MKIIFDKILRWPWQIGTAIVLLWNRTKAGKRLVTTHYTLHPESLPEEFDGLRIVHLTDLHGREFGPKQKNLLKLVADARPDLVFLTGDMYSETKKAARRAKINYLMKVLGTRYPVYAILGNHETRSKVVEDICQEMRDAGITLLRNESLEIARGEAKIRIAGLDTNPMKDMLEQEDEQYLLDRLDQTVPAKKEFTCLLAHKPELLPYYSRTGAELVFSGHAHGGLTEIPFLGKRLLAPGQGFFPKYSQGLYLEDRSLMVLNSGLGGPRYRIQPEVVIVELSTKK